MVAFTAGSVLTAANLNSAFNALTIRTVTGTSDTLVLADNGGAVTYSNASPVSVTVPLFSSIAYATGTKIVLVNLGAGTVTVAGTGGVTVNGSPLTLAQNAGATLIKTDTNTWSFLPFSSGVGAANFSNTATGSYTGYKYLTFTASGTITVTTAGFADIVVCSGGGGGLTLNGGGGAGGVLQVTNAYLPVGTLTVTVGAGGSSATSSIGGYGQPSRLGSYYSVGGAGASSSAAVAVSYGGSGAGGPYVGNAGTSGTPGLGNNGGSGSTNPAPNVASGGGGGAGAVGANGSGTTGGNGGAGTTTTIAGTTPTGAYVAGSYALGGGGGGEGDGVGGTGGSGGGGNGGVRAASGASGTANTGGGGGSGGAGAGNGGSGIVIVRVAV